MELISVIVPVYNVEKYLDRCVQSIVDQTYRNLEIILVDDGSPDKAGEICDEWAAKDRRIKVIHQENAGGGAARNAALDIASGKLIAFVDSDDYIADDMYSHLYSLLEQGADVAECGYREVWSDSEVFETTARKSVFCTAEEALQQHICDSYFRQLIWNKLYRRETIGTIRFPEGKKIDDEFFTYQVLGNARKLIRSDKACYAYRQQQQSVMHSIGVEKRLQGVEAKVQRQIYIEKNFPALGALNLKDLWFSCLHHGQRALREMDKQRSHQIFEYLLGVLQSNPVKLEGYTAKEKLWLFMAGKFFKLTCHLRNGLKIGL